MLKVRNGQRRRSFWGKVADPSVKSVDLHVPILFSNFHGVLSQDGHLFLSGFGSFLAGSVSYHYLAATTTFDDDSKTRATKDARSCSLGLGCLNPSPKSCKGRPWYSTVSKRLGFRQQPPEHDKGIFPPVLGLWAFDLRLSRTPLPTRVIMSSSESPALVYVKPSTEVLKGDS